MSAQLALSAAVREAEARAAAALETALETEKRRWSEEAAAAEETKLVTGHCTYLCATSFPVWETDHTDPIPLYGEADHSYRFSHV